jgi:prepilin-type N-terminal cleavage/methylation domain-containing protein/prepilin-type processing-associated H-X9-DG protein
MQRNSKTGFTLVELLVVISIIALLMGVLLPALSAARMRAQTIVCAYNLKGYGSALVMYADTNNDKAPFSFSWLYSWDTISKGVADKTCPEECRWHYDVDRPDGTLWPYMKSIKAHICPTFKSLAKSTTCWNSVNHPRSGRGGGTMPYNPTYCYSMNRWLGFFCPEMYKYAPDSPQAQALFKREPSLNLSKVNRASECLAFSEENMWTLEFREGDPPGVEYAPVAIGKNDLWLYANRSIEGKKMAQQNLATYHNVSPSKKNTGKANAVFVDGHVSLIRGLPGYDAYFEYGRPYRGHENFTENFW